MVNGIENGKSHSERQDPIIPDNGLFQLKGITYRAIDGVFFRVRTGEEMVREISRAEDDFTNTFYPGASLITSPFSRVPEGEQRHTRMTPQSPDNI